MKNLSFKKHFIGCDVSKGTLDFALYERGKDYRTFEHLQVKNNQEGFQAMRKWLRTLKVKLSDAVIAMEHTGMYSSALTEWCFKKGYTFVLLHPLDVKSACGRGRNKTDKVDSQFIADFVYTLREKLEPSTPESPVIKKLRQLKNERALIIKTRTAYIIQGKTIEDKAAQKRRGKMVSELNKQLESVEKQILEVVNSDESINRNFELLKSLKGVGLVNAVTTIVATGNFTRFQTARQYAKFCCVAPLSFRSGTSIKNGDHISKKGHNEIKATLTEAARSAIMHDKQLKAYYQRKRAEGKKHGIVMNAVKFKIICRMFAVIKRQTPYIDIEKFRA